MAKPTVVCGGLRGQPTCWTVVAKVGDRCPEHAAKPVVVAPKPDPETVARLAARQAERAKAAEARAANLRRVERELAETQRFMRDLQASGLAPKER